MIFKMQGHLTFSENANFKSFSEPLRQLKPTKFFLLKNIFKFMNNACKLRSDTKLVTWSDWIAV